MKTIDPFEIERDLVKKITDIFKEPFNKRMYKQGKFLGYVSRLELTTRKDHNFLRREFYNKDYFFS